MATPGMDFGGGGRGGLNSLLAGGLPGGGSIQDLIAQLQGRLGGGKPELGGGRIAAPPMRGGPAPPPMLGPPIQGRPVPDRDPGGAGGGDRVTTMPVGPPDRRGAPGGGRGVPSITLKGRPGAGAQARNQVPTPDRPPSPGGGGLPYKAPPAPEPQEAAPPKMGGTDDDFRNIPDNPPTERSPATGRQPPPPRRAVSPGRRAPGPPRPAPGPTPTPPTTGGASATPPPQPPKTVNVGDIPGGSPWGDLADTDFATRAAKLGFKDLADYEGFRERRGGDNVLGRMYDQAGGGAGGQEGVELAPKPATPGAPPWEVDSGPGQAGPPGTWSPGRPQVAAGGAGPQTGMKAGRLLPGGGVESGGFVDGKWQPNNPGGAGPQVTTLPAPAPDPKIFRSPGLVGGPGLGSGGGVSATPPPQEPQVTTLPAASGDLAGQMTPEKLWATQNAPPWAQKMGAGADEVLRFIRNNPDSPIAQKYAAAGLG